MAWVSIITSYSQLAEQSLLARYPVQVSVGAEMEVHGDHAAAVSRQSCYKSWVEPSRKPCFPQ